MHPDTRRSLRAPRSPMWCGGGEGEWEQSSTALQSPLLYWGRGAARKSQGPGLVVPRERQLSLGGGVKIPGETTGCELANLVPGAEKREVGKGEMLPGASRGTHRIMARAVPGALGRPDHEPHDCERPQAHGVTLLYGSWSFSTPPAGEPPALHPTLYQTHPGTSLPRVSGRRRYS